MELVPIITQILVIVATIFILVLFVSYIASKLRKKEHNENLQLSYSNNTNVNNNLRGKTMIDKHQYYSGSYYNSINSDLNYQKEIKVVRRSSISDNNYRRKERQIRTNSYSRFTVLNNISTNQSKQIETDEFGFKLYAENEITRSVYLSN